MILATDLALHLKYISRQYHMAQVGYNKHNKEDRYLFVSLLMTTADLSDQTKVNGFKNKSARGFCKAIFV